MANEVDWGFLTQKPSFSGKTVDKLGKYYSGKITEEPREVLDILTWYRNLGEKLLDNLVMFLPQHFSTCSLEAANTRVKTELTIAQKLERQPNLKLSKMFDFSGARLEWDCFLNDLMSMAELVRDELDKVGVRVEIKDYRENSQHGYRAVHLVVISPAGRVEVQLRTLFQSWWANTFEKPGDIVGRSIRYEDQPDIKDEGMKKTYLAMLEVSNNLYIFEKASEQTVLNNNRVLENLKIIKAQHFYDIRAP